MAALSAGAEVPVELRYRTLTHHNPGRCSVVVHRPQDAAWVCVVSDCDGHLGPPVRTAVRAVAAVIHRDLVPTGVDWQLVLAGRDGRRERVEWGEAFGGWFARPQFVPVAAPSSLDLS
jgi:hypothetical protein